MKPLYTIFVLSIGLFCRCSVDSTNNSEESTQPIKDSIPTDTLAPIDTLTLLQPEDTIFLLRSLEDHYHAIYIEKDRNSLFHNALADFTFDKNDSLCYDDTYDFFLEMNLKHKLFNHPHALPQHLVPLFEYNEDYFLYAPSDWGNARKRMITDSTFMFWYMDGVSPYPLSNITVKEAHTELVYLIPMNGKLLSKQTVEVYLLDEVRNVYLFNYTGMSPKAKGKFQLYTTADHVSDFDAIVNYSPGRKHFEYEFDPPTFNLTKGDH